MLGGPPPSCGASFPCILALLAFVSLHFGLYFLSFWLSAPSFPCFWLCGLSFPCNLALWAFISLHFGLLGLYFLSFLALWAFISLHFGGQLLGPPPHVAKNGPFAQCPYNGFISAVTGSILPFEPSGPSFLCILALWAFISLHFGFVGLHFLSFWPCGPSFPCILVVSFWAPPHKLPKMARLPNVLTMDLSAP